MFSRCRGIEESMMRNLEQMNMHRQASALIKQKRKEDQEANVKKMKEEIKQALHIDFNETLPTKDSDSNLASKKGAYQRLAKLEDNLNQNYTVLSEHRSFLNSAHAMRGQRPPTSPLEQSHSRAVEEGARWMGPAMQAAAYHKARAGTHSRPSSAPAGAPLPGAARRATSTSAVSMRTATPAPAEEADAVPKSGLYSWKNSRPPSAGSLHARMKAMEDAVKHNQDRLQINRTDLDLVKKARRERAEQATQDVLQSIKKALEIPAYVGAAQ